jgi:hypothetical protein
MFALFALYVLFDYDDIGILVALYLAAEYCSYANNENLLAIEVYVRSTQYKSYGVTSKSFFWYLKPMYS